MSDGFTFFMSAEECFPDGRWTRSGPWNHGQAVV